MLPIDFVVLGAADSDGGNLKQAVENYGKLKLKFGWHALLLRNILRLCKTAVKLSVKGSVKHVCKAQPLT